MCDSNTPVPESLDSRNSKSESPPDVIKPKSICVTKTADSSRVGSVNPLCEHTMTPEIVNQSFNITLKFISPGGSSGPFCRICHEGDATEDLVSICKCTGTVGLVHISCLERWLSSRRNTTSIDKCEICNHAFDTIRYPKSLTEWYQNDHGPTSARHSVLGDIACFSLITPLAAASTFLCIQGAKRHVLWNNSLEAGCLMAVATFLVTVYLVWNILTIRFHLNNYYKWRSINQNVRLVRFRRTSTMEQNYNETNLGSTRSGVAQVEDLDSNQRISPLPEHSLERATFTGYVTSHLRSILV